jgi:predicted TIM-barrel fold metal-dependent hydrolase
MTTAGRLTPTSGAGIRNQLDHPVIDADGHLVEHLPAVLPHLREHLPARLFDRYVSGEFAGLLSVPAGTNAERAPSRAPQAGWWGLPTRNTLDRATSMIPALLHDRMDDLGLDVSVLYPTAGFGIAGLADEELRRGLCAGWNAYLAEEVGPWRDRLRVAGVIPMHEPAEAIEEIEHCHRLGIDVVGLPHGVIRPIAEPRREPTACMWPGNVYWLDTYGLDSAHDYDPVWERCRQLGLPVTFHGGLALDTRHSQSVSSFVWNHLGLHASMMAPLAKSLVLGGVTARFPDQPFAFLEAGVGWAASMVADLVEHWERRSPGGLVSTDPAELDVHLLAELFVRFGLDPTGLDRLRRAGGPPPEERDEWRQAQVSSGRDIARRLAGNCYFGCEADDRTVAFAFSPALPFGIRLKAVLSSDLGHWDTEDIGAVVGHAWGHVREGLISPEDFKTFVFTNPARLYCSANPRFFDGTPVAGHVDALPPERAPA